MHLLDYASRLPLNFYFLSVHPPLALYVINFIIRPLKQIGKVYFVPHYCYFFYDLELQLMFQLRFVHYYINISIHLESQITIIFCRVEHIPDSSNNLDDEVNVQLTQPWRPL